MAVRTLRRVVALGALLAATVAVVACSPNQRAGGPDGAAGQSSSAAPVTVSAPHTGAPVTVVALPTTAASEPPGSLSGPTSPAGTGTAQTSTSSSTPTSSTPPPLPAATVKGNPTLGSKGIPPIEPITIKVTGGKISSLTFTNPEGKKVKGSLSKDERSWTLGEPLGYGRTYQVRGEAVNPEGKKTPIKGSYTTVSTVEPITTTISPRDGAVVGVAAPVIVRFGMNPQDKALVEKNVKITTTPKVEGSWAWITHDGDTYPSLDFRPKNYWPGGTKVHVESNIYGVKFADGWYGGDNVSADFTIGRNQVVIADAKTHSMTVKRDGKVVAKYNASLGMGDDPNGEYGLDPKLVTRSGIHIVMDKQPEVLMSNPAYGYKNVKEYWAVRISNNGEFIHWNPGTTDWQLANVNKTHGCINLGEDDAKAYYDTAMYGDPVEVINTSVKLSASDGDIHDWAIPWSTWQTLSALSANSVID
jgi:lipoprotein-anchoring transpeptidase ErfK/SrfK